MAENDEWISPPATLDGVIASSQPPSAAAEQQQFPSLDDAAALLDLSCSHAHLPHLQPAIDQAPEQHTSSPPDHGNKQKQAPHDSPPITAPASGGSSLGLPWPESGPVVRRASELGRHAHLTQTRNAPSSLDGWDGRRRSELLRSPFRSDEPLCAYAPSNSDPQQISRRESAPVSHMHQHRSLIQSHQSHRQQQLAHPAHRYPRHSIGSPAQRNSSLHTHEPLFLQAINNRTQSYGTVRLFHSHGYSTAGGSFSSASRCPSLVPDCPSPCSSRASFATDGGWPASPAQYDVAEADSRNDYGHAKQMDPNAQLHPDGHYRRPMLHHSMSEQGSEHVRLAQYAQAAFGWDGDAQPLHTAYSDLHLNENTLQQPRPWHPSRSQSVGGEMHFPLPPRAEDLAYSQGAHQAPFSGRHPQSHSRKRPSLYADDESERLGSPHSQDTHWSPSEFPNNFSPFTPGYSMRSTDLPVEMCTPHFVPPQHASADSSSSSFHSSGQFVPAGECSPCSQQARQLFAEPSTEPAQYGSLDHSLSPVECQHDHGPGASKRRKLSGQRSPLSSQPAPFASSSGLSLERLIEQHEHSNSSFDGPFSSHSNPHYSLQPSPALDDEHSHHSHQHAHSHQILPLAEPASAAISAPAEAFVDNQPPPALLRPPPSPGHVQSLPLAYPVDQVAMCHMSPPEDDFGCLAQNMPRQQKLRFEEDQYTPLWVRFDGQRKEGWCALCPDGGKWLQLKNSAFWYHRQFLHGISSVSGHPFLPPLDTRPTKGGDKTEGQCHSCGDWVTYANHKGPGAALRGAPNVWFRHAHSCHSYFSPKREAKKKEKLAGSKSGLSASTLA